LHFCYATTYNNYGLEKVRNLEGWSIIFGMAFFATHSNSPFKHLKQKQKKINDNGLPKYIKKGGEGHRDWPNRQTLNLKVEQSNISNLDI